jgi:parallel beta-helix repeat protein
MEHGILLGRGSNENTLSGNHCSYNNSAGIYLSLEGGDACEFNTISNKKVPIIHTVSGYIKQTIILYQGIPAIQTDTAFIYIIPIIIQFQKMCAASLRLQEIVTVYTFAMNPVPIKLQIIPLTTTGIIIYISTMIAKITLFQVTSATTQPRKIS